MDVTQDQWGQGAPDSFESVCFPRRTPNTSPTESLTRHQEKGPHVDIRFFFDMHVRKKMDVDMHFLHVDMQFFSEHACSEKNAC
jgi:hypothetical protein